MGGNDAELNIKGGAAALLSSMEKVNRGIGKMDRVMARSSKASEQAARKSTKLWDSVALTLRKASVAAIGVGGFMYAMRATRAEIERTKTAAEGLMKAEFAMGALAQLSKGDPKKYRQLKNAAIQTYLEGGATDPTSAALDVFQQESGGVLAKNRRFMSRLKSIDEPGDIAGALGKIRSNLGPVASGSPQSMVSMYMVGAERATKTNLSQLMMGSIAPATGAKVMGLTREELSASMSSLAQRAESGQIAGTWLRSLLKAMDKIPGFKEEYADQPFQAALDEIRVRGKRSKLGVRDPKILGNRQEAVDAFRGLTDVQTVYPEELVRAIHAGTPAGDVVMPAIRLAEGGTFEAANRRRRQREAREAMSGRYSRLFRERQADKISELALKSEEAGELFPQRWGRAALRGFAAYGLSYGPEGIEAWNEMRGLEHGMKITGEHWKKTPEQLMGTLNDFELLMRKVNQGVADFVKKVASMPFHGVEPPTPPVVIEGMD